ncbi:MAG: hypothetical protein AVDCRST_MAG66-2015 [uncultured Pseudonocardia sp.]|uniref:Transcriptional regulator, AbiEi antitoxin, Type IV TA system n=1 Tax=uncultured Pseudonocardia sp. TaxID=211455 RepID=A0A6J4PCA8_9PSEU|nr:MAG: hypothetical protein AVDCRST_MAG66-2015 [uncultured Pseudonocardia sp.]
MSPALTRTTRDRAALRAAFPSGVAAVRQLVASGVSERTAYHRCLDGGPWRHLLPGIVLLGNTDPSTAQLLEAALLLGGPDAILTDLHACRLHGLRRGPVRRAGPDEVAILTPKARQVRSVEFVHVQRTMRMPAAVLRGGFPIAPIDRACLDAARRLDSASEITELLAEPVQRSLCTVAMLGAELAAGSRRGTAMPARVLADVAEGVRSAAERNAKQLWSRARLPEARWNVPVHRADGSLVGVADCWVDDVAMVWEIESSEWHLSPEAHDRTVVRAAEFVAAGAVYTATKPRRLRAEQQDVVRTLRETHARALARTRPALWAGAPRP